MLNFPSTLPEVVACCQAQMSHAWMVRTFIKHSDEVEDFPELMGIVRCVFDTSLALETRLADPPGYLKMLSKKIGKLRSATAQFKEDASFRWRPAFARWRNCWSRGACCRPPPRDEADLL
jgi:hypothetical protein